MRVSRMMCCECGIVVSLNPDKSYNQVFEWGRKRETIDTFDRYVRERIVGDVCPDCMAKSNGRKTR